MFDNEIETNYYYDLAYYEGIRNTLVMINKHLSFGGSPKENINRLLKEIREELEDAKNMHKESENKYLSTRNTDQYGDVY